MPKKVQDFLGTDFNFDNIYGNPVSSEKGEIRDPRRAFSSTQRKEILYQQDNKCARCHNKLDPRGIEYDHKKPWASGGRTIITNGRALCGTCHKIVTHETKLKEIDKKRLEKPTSKPNENLNPLDLGKNPFADIKYPF